MNDEIERKLSEQNASIVRFVDISGFPENQTLGFSKAILICMVLSKKYVINMINNEPIDENDEFLTKERKVEELADCLASYLEQKGYHAHSQSEKSNMESGFIECAYIDPDLKQGIGVLPQKSIARASGLGFIGKNNLLVTKEYGCALCMCSVLTDAPVLTTSYPAVPIECGSCEACVKGCPANAIRGNEWTLDGGRESLVDVSKCCCALRCMIICPWTLRYAN